MMGTIGSPLREIHQHYSSSTDQDSKDQDIVDSVRLRLDDSGYIALRKVKVFCDHRRVTLQGKVATYFLKQVAQTAVMSAAGECEIDNDIRVTHERRYDW